VRSAAEQSAVAAETSAHDWEVEVLASPLDPAGSLRVHIVANGARRVLGDRARRPLTTACIASGVALSEVSFPACRPLAVHIVRRELAGLFEERANRHA
jgi:hypothetical protein